MVHSARTSTCLIIYARGEGDVPPKHCYVWGLSTIPFNVAVLVNDTLVFIGVSLHVYRNTTLDTSRLSHARRFTLLLQGNGLYKVSRMLLNSGLLYYG